MKVNVASYDLYLYREVFEILEWKGNTIYRTRTTGKYIKLGWKNPDMLRWYLSPPSTSLMRSDSVTLELFEPNHANNERSDSASH